MKPHDWGFHTIRIWKQSIGSPKQNGLIKNKYQGWLWPQFEGDSPLRWIDSDWNQTYLHQYFQKGGNRALIISHTYLRRHYDGIMNLQILHSFPNIQCLLLCQYFNFLRARHYYFAQVKQRCQNEQILVWAQLQHPETSEPLTPPLPLWSFQISTLFYFKGNIHF